ncbi:hypothetical protein HQQ80_11485 [Microbacteriaceae bacterium VKM Ac-2855]|nr:hypothetical protein [Microbacteriaceae bacterium VKM Ac-2855]
MKRMLHSSRFWGAVTLALVLVSIAAGLAFDSAPVAHRAAGHHASDVGGHP